MNWKKKVGNSFTGDIAIDDIASNVGACPSTYYCDFESEDICGFTNYTLAAFTWTRNKGSTDSLGTGPIYDHVSRFFSYSESN